MGKLEHRVPTPVVALLLATGMWRLAVWPPAWLCCSEARLLMALGLVFALAGLLVLLWSPWALLGPVLFVAWITRRQIVPEVRVLETVFGEDYRAYRARVRRWI